MDITSPRLSVEEFLEVREEVAARIKLSGQRTESRVRERQAEQLMGLGYIDVHAVLSKLHPAPEPNTVLATMAPGLHTAERYEELAAAAAFDRSMDRAAEEFGERLEKIEQDSAYSIDEATYDASDEEPLPMPETKARKR